MCSTKEPKVRRLTGATTKAGSRCSDALIMRLVLPPEGTAVSASGGSGDRRRGRPGGRVGGLDRPPTQKPSALQAGPGDALDDVALEEQEDEHQWQTAQQGRGHDVRVP